MAGWTTDKKCLPQMNVCASRVMALDADGSSTVGAGESYATAATVLLGLTPVYDPGAEIKEKDGCGATFVDTIAPPTLVRYDIDIDVWSTDPNYLKIVLPQGSTLTVPGSGQVGFAYPDIGVVSGQFSLEFWQKVINNNKPDPDFPFAWWLLPFLTNIQLQKRDVDGTKVSHTVLKAEGYGNTNWFDGPTNDWPVASSAPVQYIPWTALPTMNCLPTTVAS